LGVVKVWQQTRGPRKTLLGGGGKGKGRKKQGGRNQCNIGKKEKTRAEELSLLGKVTLRGEVKKAGCWQWESTEKQTCLTRKKKEKNKEKSNRRAKGKKGGTSEEDH